MWITRSACPVWPQSWSRETDRAYVHMADLVRFVVSLASGDERGSVGTGTDERIRQERPTSTGFCIGDIAIVTIPLCTRRSSQSSSPEAVAQSREKVTCQ
jgi:hypothetical protein